MDPEKNPQQSEDEASHQTSNTTTAPEKKETSNTTSTADSSSLPDQSHVINFTPDDPNIPLNWSRLHKWTIVILLSLLIAAIQLATILAAPVAPQLLTHFHSSPLYRTLLVTIWELGEATGPLLSGPLSEVFGRLPVTHVSNLLFVIFSAGTALSTSMSMLIAFRFLSGAAAAVVALGPGIVGDLFSKEERGAAMSVMSLAGLLGPVVGPIAGGYVGQYAGWRWAFWLVVILSGALSLLFAAVYRESYKVVLLRRAAARKSRETGEAWVSAYEDGDGVGRKIWKAVVRPMRLLIVSPVLLLLTVYMCVSYGYTYLVMTTIAPVFEGYYGFSEGASGLAFLGLAIGLIVAALACSRALDWYVKKARANSADVTPEQRLPPLVVAGVITPVGMFLYGWTAQYRVQYVVPIIGTGIIGMALSATLLSIRTYVVDAFGIHAVSATTATYVPRNLAAAVLPLIGPPLYDNLGVGWASSVLGFIALAFVPLPLILKRYGLWLRGVGKFKLVE